MMREDLIELAKQQAAEIASAGHNGWGNTMLELAVALESSVPVGVEGLMQLARNWCLAWGEWAHDADPGCAKENAAEAALRAALTQALAQQPAADLRSTHRVWRENDWLPCYCAAASDHHIGNEQPTAVEETMRKVAAIAHSGGLIDMSPHDALTAIRRLSLPYWGKEEKPEQVHAALITQQLPSGRENEDDS